MSITRKKFIASLGEVWCDEAPDKNLDVDVLYYHQWSYPIQGLQCKEFYTLFIDLTQEQDKLWKNIEKNTRKQIRRAEEKDQLVFEYWDKSNFEILQEFLTFYDEFALDKGIPKVNRDRLRGLMNAGALDISRINSNDGTPLVWHACYRSKTLVEVLHSASMFRKSTNSEHRHLLGRANRYLYWRNILRFKNLNFSILDLGGWYGGNENQEKLRINQFKEGFGGEVVKVFGCSQGVTVMGKLYLQLRNLLIKSY
jgi:hypothetical protein